MMTRRNLLASMSGALLPPPLPQPNIVLILADDLGYGDIGCFGSTRIRTPALDRMATEGVRLTTHYVASPVCSPSRAGLLTGRYSQRTGVTGVLRETDDATGLSLQEVTVADVLGRNGYATGLVGKWHLGMSPGYWPRRRGFQSYYGFLNGVIDHFSQMSTGGGGKGTRTTYRNEERIAEEGYFPELLNREAVRFVETADPARSFFLYFAHPLPHLPLQAPDQWLSRYRNLTDRNQATYAAMVSCMDDGIGRLLDAVRRRPAGRETLVVFLSDNGWSKLTRGNPSRSAGDNRPFRGGKYELLEGGLRSPCIAWWPGRIKAGGTLPEITCALDWFPTLKAIAGIDAPDKNRLDGRNILPVLTHNKRLPERQLFWEFQDDLVGTPLSYAVRKGRWKYLKVGEAEMLYDLHSDSGETRNVATRHADILSELRAGHSAWRTEIESGASAAKLPAP